MPDDSFYIGYHPIAPTDTARLGRRLIVALVGGAAVLGALIASRQPRADPSVFEYGIERSFEGQIVEHPYPALLVPRPGITDRGVAYSRYLLVAQGKHGAQEIVKGLDGGGEPQGVADLPRWGNDGRGGTRGEQVGRISSLIQTEVPVASLCTARSH
jgi:hypothetical protein